MEKLVSVGSVCSEPVEFLVRREVDFFCEVTLDRLVGVPWRLNSVEPTEFSWSFLPIFWNDPPGLLGWPG